MSLSKILDDPLMLFLHARVMMKHVAVFTYANELLLPSCGHVTKRGAVGVSLRVSFEIIAAFGLVSYANCTPDMLTVYYLTI